MKLKNLNKKMVERNFNILLLIYLTIGTGLVGMLKWNENKKSIINSYPSPGASVSGGINDMVLVYSEGDRGRNWSVNDFKQYLLHFDNLSKPDFLLFDSFLFMALYDPIDGTDYYPSFGNGPGNSSSWKRIIDKWFLDNQDIDALDKAVSWAKSLENAPINNTFKAKIVFSIPYPDPTQKNFGILQPPYGDGKNSLDFASINARVSAFQWIIDYIESRWSEKYTNSQNLELIGYYWINEKISDEEIPVIKAFTSYVKEISRKSFWIPYYLAPGIKNLREFEFDSVCMQPNLFFDYRRNYITPIERVNLTSDVCYRYGMSVEFEMDEHLFSNETWGSSNQSISFLQRRLLYIYMYSGVQKGHMKALNIYYQGVWALKNMIEAWNQTTNLEANNIWRKVYDDFCAYVNGTLEIDPIIFSEYGI